MYISAVGAVPGGGEIAHLVNASQGLGVPLSFGLLADGRWVGKQLREICTKKYD